MYWKRARPFAFDEGVCNDSAALAAETLRPPFRSRADDLSRSTLVRDAGWNMNVVCRAVQARRGGLMQVHIDQADNGLFLSGARPLGGHES